jgi:hypothetical protein
MCGLFKYCFVFTHLPHDFHVIGYLVKKKGGAQGTIPNSPRKTQENNNELTTEATNMTQTYNRYFSTAKILTIELSFQWDGVQQSWYFS